MTIELKMLISKETPAVQWILLMALYIVGVFIQERPTALLGAGITGYAVVYIIAFALIGITLGKAYFKEKIGTLFAIMTALVGTMTWITSAGYINQEAGMWVTIIFAVLAFLDEYEILKTQRSYVNTKYCLIAALTGIFLFGFLYFLHRLGIVPVGLPFVFGWTGALPWFTILNHAGIFLLAGIDMIILYGIGDWQSWSGYRWLFFLVAVIGAIGILYNNFGLGLLQ